MTIQFLCILLMVSVNQVPAAATTAHPTEDVLTQQQAVALALENNPDLQVSLDQLKAIRHRIAQAGDYPATSIEWEMDQTKLLRSYDEASYGVSQLIEYPTRRGLRISLAKEEAKVSESDYDLIRWELTLAVKTLYQRLALSQLQARIAGENVAILEKLLTLAQRRFEAGSVSKLDVLRARVEAGNAADEKLLFENGERNYRMQLNYLLGREAAAPLVTSPLSKGAAVSESVDYLVDLALSQRIEFRTLRNKQSAAVLRQSLARSAYYPDFSAAFYRHQYSGDMDSWKMNFGIVIPIFGRGAIGGRIAEAKAEEKAVLTEAEAERARVEMEVRNSFKDAAALSDRVTLYQEVILASAEEAFRLAEANYHEGEIDNLELLLSQKTLQDVRKRSAETMFAYNLRLIDLEQAVGGESGRIRPGS